MEQLDIKTEAIPDPALPGAAPTGDPTLLAGKYKTQDDLVKGYLELQKAFSAKPGAAPTDPTPTPAPADPAKPAGLGVPATPSPDDAAKALEGKGLDINKFSSEFQQAGALTPESYTELEKAGIPKAMVDQYIAGQTAIAEQNSAVIHASVGGPEAYATMIQWAGVNLSAAEKEAFNTSINGNIEQTKLAVAGLHAKYISQNGKAPNLVTGAGGGGGSDVYASRAQLTADMGDPRYAKDEAFRKSVHDKLGRSSIF